MVIKEQLLTPGHYIAQEIKKDTIYIHHTAGSYRPDYTIGGWEAAKYANGQPSTVSTAWVIGGTATSSNDTSFDGVVYKAFDDKYWAYHLGINAANNTLLNSKSIAIEICNYGPLTKHPDGTFTNYVNSQIPAHMVGELETPWRGYTYFHKYTPAQLASLKELLIMLSNKYNIDLKAGMTQFINNGLTAFDLNPAAAKGTPGLWTHVNIRQDKTDCWPQPELIELIKSL